MDKTHSLTYVHVQRNGLLGRRAQRNRHNLQSSTATSLSRPLNLSRKLVSYSYKSLSKSWSAKRCTTY